MRIKNSLLFLFFLFNILITNAQSEKIISLEEVLTKVEKNNRTIKISEQDYNVQRQIIIKPTLFYYQTLMFRILPLQQQIR